MSDWQTCQVVDLEKKKLLLVQDGNHGENRPRKTEFVDDGVAFIRAANLSHGAVQFVNADKISKVATERITKGVGNNLDTILSTKGTVGKIAFVPIGSPAFVCSPQTSFWRSLDHEFLDPTFLYYELQSAYFRGQMTSRKGDTDMADYLSLTSQRSLFIRIPDIQKQRHIAAVLGVLDGQLRLNHQINQTLEQIAQAIFKNWFVDFEPVKAKQHIRTLGGNNEQTERAAQAVIAGAVNLDVITTATDLSALDQRLTQALSEKLTHQTDAQCEQLAASARHFPNQIVKTEHGDLPIGWRNKPLYETAKFINGAAFKNKNFSSGKEGMPIIKIVELKSGVTSRTKFTTDTFPEKYLIDDHELLYSWSGSPNTSLEVFKWFGGPGWLNQHIFRVCTEDMASRYFVFFLLRQLKPLLISIATDKQTTGLGHVTVADMKRLYLAVPDDKILRYFEHIAGPLYNKASSCEQQSRLLMDIRDSLLPKLLSGELAPNQLHQIHN